MPRTIRSKPPLNQARRHFLGVAAALGARAVGGIAAASVLPLAARAEGRGPPKLNFDPPGNGKGRGRNPPPHGPSKVSCFLRRTPIQTPSGEVAVDDLKIGDLVTTSRGEALPIRWIGRQTFRKSGSAWPDSALPIRVARHALDEHTPHTDLYLSPRHALFIDGLLIEARELVNGLSIAPTLPTERDEIAYFNLVLDTHAVILAAGAPAETCLLQDGDHERFTNFAEFEHLYPEGLAVMTPLGPVLGCEGGRAHLKALLRLSASYVLRRRDPVQDLYQSTCQRLVARAAERVG